MSQWSHATIENLRYKDHTSHLQWLINCIKCTLPTRSNTHPLPNHTKLGHNTRNSPLLDSEELYRRLQRHKEAEERARERRRSRSEKSKPSPEYHHVPRYAAMDFVSTATPDTTDNQNIHPLSRCALKASSSAARGQGNGQNELNFLQVIDDMDTIAQAALILAERNQFQHSKTLQSAAQVDKLRNLNKPVQRDFEAIGKAGGLSRSRNVHAADFEVPPTEIRLPRAIHNPGDRHDWAQNEDVEERTAKGSKRLTIHKRRNFSVDMAIKEEDIELEARSHVLDSGTSAQLTSHRRASSLFSSMFKH